MLQKYYIFVTLVKNIDTAKHNVLKYKYIRWKMCPSKIKQIGGIFNGKIKKEKRNNVNSVNYHDNNYDHISSSKYKRANTK